MYFGSITSKAFKNSANKEKKQISHQCVENFKRFHLVEYANYHSTVTNKRGARKIVIFRKFGLNY